VLFGVGFGCVINVFVGSMHRARQPLGLFAPGWFRIANQRGSGIHPRIHARFHDGFHGKRAGHFAVCLASHAVSEHKQIERLDNAEAILVIRAHPPHIGYAAAYDPHKFSRCCLLFESVPTPVPSSPVLTLADPFRRRKVLTLTNYLFFRHLPPWHSQRVQPKRPFCALFLRGGKPFRTYGAGFRYNLPRAARPLSKVSLAFHSMAKAKKTDPELFRLFLDVQGYRLVRKLMQ